eukprot:g47757.t1
MLVLGLKASLFVLGASSKVDTVLNGIFASRQEDVKQSQAAVPRLSTGSKAQAYTQSFQDAKNRLHHKVLKESQEVLKESQETELRIANEKDPYIGKEDMDFYSEPDAVDDETRMSVANSKDLYIGEEDTFIHYSDAEYEAEVQQTYSNGGRDVYEQEKEEEQEVNDREKEEEQQEVNDRENEEEQEVNDQEQDWYGAEYYQKNYGTDNNNDKDQNNKNGNQKQKQDWGDVNLEVGEGENVRAYFLLSEGQCPYGGPDDSEACAAAAKYFDFKPVALYSLSQYVPEGCYFNSDMSVTFFNDYSGSVYKECSEQRLCLCYRSDHAASSVSTNTKYYPKNIAKSYLEDDEVEARAVEMEASNYYFYRTESLTQMAKEAEQMATFYAEGSQAKYPNYVDDSYPDMIFPDTSYCVNSNIQLAKMSNTDLVFLNQCFKIPKRKEEEAERVMSMLLL